MAIFVGSSLVAPIADEANLRIRWSDDALNGKILLLIDSIGRGDCHAASWVLLQADYDLKTLARRGEIERKVYRRSELADA